LISTTTPGADGSGTLLLLSNGASAFIRLADGRLKAFSNLHMYASGSIVDIQKQTLQTLLKSYCGYVEGAPCKESASAMVQLSQRFKYNPLRFESSRSLKSALPAPLANATDTFQQAINIHYNKVLEEI
jgi:hypothetical protein